MERADDAIPVPVRRRARAERPRGRQVVVRFSDAELLLVRARAALAGLAVGAWIGRTVLDVAENNEDAVGLPDLLRLHTDVVLFDRAAASGGRDLDDEVALLLARLDAVIDIVVAARGRPAR